MWFVTALSTDFGQTGFAPVEELLIISRIYIIYPIPNHTPLDGVSRYGYVSLTVPMLKLVWLHERYVKA
jgi:hypothetical protein